MNMKTSEILIAARKLIEKPENWVQEAYQVDGCMCAKGAMYGGFLGRFRSAQALDFD